MQNRGVIGQDRACHLHVALMVPIMVSGHSKQTVIAPYCGVDLIDMYVVFKWRVTLMLS